MFCRLLLSVVCGSILGFAVARAQSELTLHAESTLVVVPVAVTDASNRFVLNLDKDNFALLEDGVKQKITQFSGEDAPLSIGLLVDTSGSMGSKLETSRKAVAEFLKTANRDDETFLVTFSDHAELLTGFTHDAAAVEARLESAQSQGLTALLDAVHVGLEEMKQARNARKALLIISDGGDNNSRYTAAEIASVVREADIQIYSMGVFEPVMMLGLTPAEVSGPRLLAEISEQTGGNVFPARSLSALPAIARRIGIELRNEYVLAYAPSNSKRDGKYRKIEVKLAAPEGLPNVKARWRAGYYAARDESTN